MEKPGIVLQAWRFLRPTLIILAAALLITGSTFFVWDEFTWRTYSDRLFWAGIGSVVVGGMAIWSALGSYSTLGTPNVLTASGDARIAHSRVAEHIKMNAKRYTASIRWLAAGALCMLISALVEIATR
jgi:hypothetical protein